ncbi:MAG TPA: CDF family Co(II)/Ni(II) efflux transporter DmeF [Pseudolabrys sp.]|nr:CDF family Co(II)/Ni(II) efflux transporter DmeF [Pseudolabrys sp.]
MHSHNLERWTHEHVFLGAHHARNEARTWTVVAITAAMMVAEIAGGSIFGSMALTADGWHMSTHAAALGIAGWAYLYARRHVHDPRYAFGTGKVGELAGFTSAVALAIVAILIAYESVLRLLNPVPIAYGEAMAIATLGLVVNVVSAWLLSGGAHHHHGHGHQHDHDRDEHDHEHDHEHDGHPHHRDLNLRAAYMHVIADAATSVLAIGSLGAGWVFGWTAADPVIGIVGAGVILSWSATLMRDAAGVLLDRVPLGGIDQRIRRHMELGDDRVCDLHVWRLGPGHHAAIVSIVSESPKEPSVYKRRIAHLRGLSHVTVEVHHCPDHGRLAA